MRTLSIYHLDSMGTDWATLGQKYQLFLLYLGVPLGAQSSLCVCLAYFFVQTFSELGLPPLTHTNTYTAAAKLMHIKTHNLQCVQNTEYRI